MQGGGIGAALALGNKGGGVVDTVEEGGGEVDGNAAWFGEGEGTSGGGAPKSSEWAAMTLVLSTAAEEEGMGDAPQCREEPTRLEVRWPMMGSTSTRKIAARAHNGKT